MHGNGKASKTNKKRLDNKPLSKSRQEKRKNIANSRNKPGEVKKDNKVKNTEKSNRRVPTYMTKEGQNNQAAA